MQNLIPRNLGINAQIGLSMACAALLVAFVIGGFERRSETKRLNADLLNQADLTVSLITGMMIEPIIVQDGPVLESAMQEALDRNPRIQSLTIFDYDGIEIAGRGSSAAELGPNSLRFERDIRVEGEFFGRMEIVWSTTEGLALINENVQRTRLTIATTVGAVSALFLILANALAMRPLRQIHARISEVLSRSANSQLSLSPLASREFRALNESVTMLERSFEERDLRETALREAKDKADRATKAKSEFLANMSHEIRTPMNGVIGMAELMLETELNDDQKIYAETISKSGASLLTIINDILNFSKIESGKLELEDAPFDLQSALEDVVTLLSAKAQEKNVEIALRYDPRIPRTFLGDVGRIRQIVTNIAGNAVKFTLEGFVFIEVSAEQTTKGNEVSIKVKDTGIGIPQERMTAIFEEFEQVENARSRQFEGTGLGLAISRRLVSLMDGKVTASSKVNQGSEFLITLPLVESDAEVERSTDTPIEMSGLSVLVVDDLELNRRILSERLSTWGVNVSLAESGAEALAVIKNCQLGFDLIIQDFQMPGMDGLSLARAIRKDEGTSSVPLIILSSIDQSISFAERADIGNCELLQKPVRSEQLRKTMARLLQPKPKEQKAATPKITAPLLSSGLRVLVAEDNATNRLIVKSMLKNEQMDLKFAENGHEAVECFHTFAPDIVFMDMSMPGLDGVEATTRIRRAEAENPDCHCPIVALTANALKEDQSKCFEAGMDDFITKPISKQSLLSALNKWIQQDRRRRA